MRDMKSVFRGLTGVWLALLIFFSVGLGIANRFRTDIDRFLETDSFEYLSDSDDYAYESDKTVTELIQAHKELGERLLEEGAVLLKNEGETLPVDTSAGAKVTLFGMRSYAPQYGGTVNATPAVAQNVPLHTALNERGFQVNPEMVSFYQELSSIYKPGTAEGANNSIEEVGATVNEVPRIEYAAAPDNFGEYSDAAIVVLGRDCGEAADYYPGSRGIADPTEFSESKTGNILGLSDDERDLIDYVKEQGIFKKIVVLLNTTPTMEVAELEEDSAIGAILWIGTPGNYGFYGVADILNGTVSPSGHLPDTYAANTANSAAAQNMGVYVFSNAAEIDPTFASGNRSLRNSWYIAELEGIYIGYKYYETRYYDSVVNPDSGAGMAVGASSSGGWAYENEVVYPFGYGLSYSTFREEIVGYEIDLNGTSSVQIKVTNMGDVAAKHAVQLYVSLPWEEGQVEKSAIQLVGYAKTGDAEESENGYAIGEPVLLGPGESETVTITFDALIMASYDENEGDGAYILDAGEYRFAVGNGAHEALQNVMRASGELGDGIAADGLAFAVENDSRIVIDEIVSGKTVSNQLQDMDLNKVGAQVTYLTRSDWEGTFPQTLHSLAATSHMQERLKNSFYDAANYTEEEGEHVFGTEGAEGEYRLSDLIGKTDFEDPAYANVLSCVPLSTMTDHMVQAFQSITAIPEIGSPEVRAMGGIVGLMARMGRYNEEGTKYYLDSSSEEARYNANTFCTEPVVAATFSHRMAQLQGDVLGNDTLWTGMKWWYGIGLNIHRSPYNGRNNEYYSEDAVLTGTMGRDVAEGAAPYGGIIGVKHYAFNDQEANREGLAVYMSEQHARENELRGFQIAITGGNIGSVMTSYNRIGSTYSSAHEGAIGGILRGEWDFHKIVITDMVHGGENYMLPKESFVAGTDFIMSSTNFWPDWTAETVLQDKVLQDVVCEAWHHVLYAMADSNIMNGVTQNSGVVRVYPWWEQTLIGAIAASAVIFAAACGLSVYAYTGQKKESEGK